MTEPHGIVLYVEDESNDRLLMQMAVAKEGLERALRTVNDGQAALDYLSGAAPYADREKYPSPAVVLLDLNLPEIHGFEVLKWIRAHPLYCELPVVIFSSSPREEDRERAQLLGANEFICKPSSMALLREVMRKLDGQWLSGAVLKAAGPVRATGAVQVVPAARVA